MSNLCSNYLSSLVLSCLEREVPRIQGYFNLFVICSFVFFLFHKGKSLIVPPITVCFQIPFSVLYPLFFLQVLDGWFLYDSYGFSVSLSVVPIRGLVTHDIKLTRGVFRTQPLNERLRRHNPFPRVTLPALPRRKYLQNYG